MQAVLHWRSDRDESVEGRYGGFITGGHRPCDVPQHVGAFPYQTGDAAAEVLADRVWIAMIAVPIGEGIASDCRDVLVDTCAQCILRREVVLHRAGRNSRRLSHVTDRGGLDPAGGEQLQRAIAYPCPGIEIRPIDRHTTVC